MDNQLEASGVIVNTPDPITVGATMQFISKTGDVPKANPNLVKVKVHYPKDYKATRYMEEGKTYEVSPETAQQFTEMKIAQILK